MKKIRANLNGMEKHAERFLRHGLEAVLFFYIFMAAYMGAGSSKAGLDLYLMFLTAREMALYLALSFLLVICGGLFIDIAIKKEKDKN